MAFKSQIRFYIKFTRKIYEYKSKIQLYILPIVVNMHKNISLKHYYLYFYRHLDKI